MIIRPFLNLLSAFLLVSVQCHATENFSPDSGSTAKLGVMGGWSTGPYEHFDRKIVPFPVIIYDSPVFYIRGVETGLKLLSSISDEISLSASMYHPSKAVIAVVRLQLCLISRSSAGSPKRPY